MVGSRARTRIAVSLIVAALAAASCGGGDGNGGETAGTLDAGLRQGVGQQLGGTPTTAADAARRPNTIEEWEALWAKERTAMVDRIKQNGWGKSADGSTLSGPEGYKLNLSACPRGWSDTEGVSDTEVKIGWPGPLSGPLGDFGNMPKGAAAVLRHYAATGAFKDSLGKTRDVNVVIRDDGYDPARTIPLVDELLDSERVFALATMISSGTLATYDKTNARCVAHYSTTGHPAWGDPVNHPWISGMILGYTTEAILWGSYIERHLDEWGGKVKIAGLVMSNDFGKAYDSAFRAFIAQSPRAKDFQYVTEGLEPQAPIVKDQMTTLAAKQPDVFVAMLTGTACTQVIVEAAENGLKEKLKAGFLGTGCKASTFIGRDKVGGDGSAANGWMVAGGGLKDFNAAAFDNDPWIASTRKVLAEAGYDYRTSSNYTWGASLGWQIAQALQVAGQLPGGLTRSNLNLAVRTMNMTNPGLVEGVKFNMNGNADAYLIEGSDLSRFNSAKQSWEVEAIVELSGKSSNCSWNTSSSTCR
jgi:ABC-type branched-subunit amino acid transport system substrate-binding protein